MTHELTVVQFSKMLKNLSALLDKSVAYAESKKIPLDVLLGSRLALDQFNLTRQIQIACDTAKLGVARLTNKEAPSHADGEATVPDLKARIDGVIAYLGTVKPEDFAEAATRRISQPRWDGQYLTGHEYLMQHVVPNFYFHVTTAYSILRHHGIELGKKDYLGPMPLKR